MRPVPMPGSNLPAPLLHDHDTEADHRDPLLVALERAMLAPLDPADSAADGYGCFR